MPTNAAPSHPTAHRDRALALLEFAHGQTRTLIRDFPHDKLTHQPSPTDNHALWTIGHLATGYAWFKSLLDGKMHPLPETYNALFGMGSKPVSDPKVYPPFEQVSKHSEEAYAALLAAARAQTDADLVAPTAADAHGFARDRLDAIEKTAWHEGWHAGQLAGIRKALGLKPTIG